MTTKTTTRTAAKATKKAPAANNNIAEAGSLENTGSQAKPVVAKDIDVHQYITVRNGFQGKLVYISSKTGESFTWDEFGSEQEMELLELRNAKSGAKKFFINNWFMFDDEWVIDYLGLRQYYKHAVQIEDFDKIFSKTPAEIKEIIAGMSDGQKKSVAYRASVLIAEGKIDSHKVITTLEESLNVELIER